MRAVGYANCVYPVLMICRLLYNHNNQYTTMFTIIYHTITQVLVEIAPQVAPLPPRRPVLQDVPLQFHLPKKDPKFKRGIEKKT